MVFKVPAGGRPACFSPAGTSYLDACCRALVRSPALRRGFVSAQTTSDLVVYGGTAGGIITAVSAAREGLTVVLLEPGAHLGGMATGGLSRTDLARRKSSAAMRRSSISAWVRNTIWPVSRKAWAGTTNRTSASRSSSKCCAKPKWMYARISGYANMTALLNLRIG